MLIEYWTGLEDDVSIVHGLRARDVKYFKWGKTLVDYINRVIPCAFS